MAKAISNAWLKSFFTQLRAKIPRVIVSIQQTVSSTADGGKNVFTVTDDKGKTSALTVYNGSKGSAGAKGAQGEKGEAGTAATITVGTVTTGAAGTSAKITNAGTSSAAVLNFTIPRGATGAKGDTGEAGAKGEKGDTGAAGTPAYTAITKSALNALIKAGNADQNTVYLVTDADSF